MESPTNYSYVKSVSPQLRLLKNAAHYENAIRSQLVTNPLDRRRIFGPAKTAVFQCKECRDYTKFFWGLYSDFDGRRFEAITVEN